jgi:protein-S-isoprenylcysteine O-methyltransferase Ste14
MNQTSVNILSVGGYLFMLAGILSLYFTGTLFSYEPVVIALQVLAVGLMAWARITFGGRSFHLTANPTEGGLVTSGPYKFIRHPIYAAVLLFALPGLVANFSLLGTCSAAVMLAGTFARIFCEEHLVRKQYPEYNQYAEKTKRLIPFLF